MNTDNNHLPPLRDIAGQLQALAADLEIQGMRIACEKAMGAAEHLFEHARAALAQRQADDADTLLIREAIDYGQFADDMPYQLAKSVRDAIKRKFNAAPAAREPLSSFINASPGEKRQVYERVMAKASAMQSAVLQQAKPDVADIIAGTLQTSRAHAYELMDQALRDALPAPVVLTEEELTTGYVQRVPDHCDRITWRNRYYQLPLDGAAPVAPTRCAAGRDGDCVHTQCPQLRDGEPHATGRHCPLDINEDQA